MAQERVRLQRPQGEASLTTGRLALVKPPVQRSAAKKSGELATQGNPYESGFQANMAMVPVRPQGPAALRAKPINQTGLPDSLKSGIESLSGISLDDVKVHYNSSQPGQLDALAYAQGSDIHIAPGQHQHLPHEAWHVVQQAQGRVKPTTQISGAPLNDDAALEAEADRMGTLALTHPEQSPVPNPDGKGGVTQAKVIQCLNSKQKKALDPIKATVTALATPEERWNAIKAVLDARNEGTDKNIAEGATYLKVAATKPVVAPVAPAGPATPFNSLAEDVTAGLYTVSTASAKIRQASGEKDFEEYSDGNSVAVAVGEAIEGLDLTGSIPFRHSRHDFQPTSAGNRNLQVQLGGSAGRYRVGKGDTSSTLVVIEEALWQDLRTDAPRLKLILQAAHRQSFANTQRVELRRPA